MSAQVAQWGPRWRGTELGLSLLAWLAALTTGLAILIIWTLLSSPAEVASAAAKGVPQLLNVVLGALYEGLVALFAWL